MARGWESKAVESQQDSARQQQSQAVGGAWSAVDRSRESKRRVMLLARARTAADLLKAEAPAQREMLERALADLDRVIAELTVRPS
jgi:hypothetical protein